MLLSIKPFGLAGEQHWERDVSSSISREEQPRRNLSLDMLMIHAEM